jgi:CheY-like chemotaxis protein
MNEIKILIIEDELFLRDLYVHILTREGYKVAAAYDGEAGLQLVQDNPDAKLILLDIMLPKIHGVDVLRRLKADPLTKNIPVLILSNLTEQHVIDETLKLGAQGYLVKLQIKPIELVEKIKSNLEANASH